MVPLARWALVALLAAAAVAGMVWPGLTPPARAAAAGAAALLMGLAEPRALTVLSERPVYIDDAQFASQRGGAALARRRQKAKRVFRWGVALSTAAGVALVVEWFSMTERPASAAEGVAVVGGILSAARRVHACAARLILHWMRLYVRAPEVEITAPSPRSQTTV